MNIGRAARAFSILYFVPLSLAAAQEPPAGADGAQPPPADPTAEPGLRAESRPTPNEAAKETPKETAAEASAKAPTGKFEFGSYGRVRFASDLRGGTGRQTNIVTRGSRMDEESYAELELRREDTWREDISSRVVTTLALFPPFFHFSGNPTQQIAIRNLYAQATYKGYNLWVGSRMYRGDDIYLLDWWPLDNQNTLGGGVSGRIVPGSDATTLALHIGMQRLDNAYQFQRVPVVAPFGVGATEITKLDRPRVVETLKLTHLIREPSAKNGFKVIAYGEAHQLAAGVGRDELTKRERPLPDDSGWLLGSELAYWTGERDTFVQLFLRHARGVAAYDPLAVPMTFANDKTTSGTVETTLALGGNWESEYVGVLYAAYLRWFRDGDPSPTSTQKYDEGTIVARPQIFFGEHWGLALEGSYQQRRLGVVDPETESPLSASVLKFGAMPYFSPSGRGSYKRPQLRLLYVLSSRNAGARALYPVEDAFAQHHVDHFLGLGAEWWFNSSSYP